MTHDKHKVPLFGRLAMAVAYVGIALTLGSFAARRWWPLELLCHARAHVCVVLFIAAAFLLWGGCRKHAAVATLFGLVQLAFIAPLYFNAPQPTKDSPDVRVMAINVLTSNRDYNEVVEILRRTEPDIVVLPEVDQRWIDGLAAIEEIYPHRHHQLDTPYNFGIAIYSRLPLTTCEFVELDGSSIVAIVATAEIAGRDVRIIGAHPIPPLGAYRAAVRNRQLAHLARIAAEHSGPTIMLGDLNATGWSPYFHDLLRDGNLIDTRTGFGIQTSHTTVPLVRIPIDHILVSPRISTHNRWVERCHGSDHDAVVADLSFNDADPRDE